METQKLDDIWKSVKGELEVLSNPAHFKTHIPGTHIKKIDETDRIIEITSPSEFQRNFIEDRFYGHIKEICTKILGKEYRLMFSISKREPTQIAPKDLGPLFQEEKEDELSALEKAKEAGLNDRYTMGRFIVGNSNRLAYAVSTAIADAPGKVYNPFFLHSGVGLGKTHLIHAIGHEVLKKHPEMKVLYITGEQFLNEVVESARRGDAGTNQRDKMVSLKRKYRNANLLIIDDVHAIAGKPATQEEFFNTFNTLYMANKQIILTSDRAPHEIQTLEERLSSRFASGMIADIQPPDYETRIAILKERNDELNLDAPDEIIEYIATTVTTNIRELEASLLQTVVKARSMGQNLTTDSASSILGQISKDKEQRITPNLIIREVTKYYGITVKEVKGNRRMKNLVFPRQTIMYLLREMTGLGFQSIGELLGGRDHTTILHGVAKTQKLIESNPTFNKELSEIKNQIKLNQS